MGMSAWGRARVAGFRNAFRGVALAFRTQPHVQVQTAWAIGLGLWGVWERLTPVEWGLLASAVAVVLVAELMNTAIEFTVDLVSREMHPLAGGAKDVAAGAVLMAAAYAVAITILVFGPRCWTRIMQ